ncbi:ABC transporter substrate-binding protein [Halosimplex salinum]|uniref:ABC transporter substrate-binding protein n=1 Tax=Halosimplex salinum TaxID=1710538 RepID=UPI001F24AFC9|nr:ABC transporter substrate-binding protein [Halosimplex salinum]
MRKPDSIRDKELSRRQYAQILAGMGAAGLAGCGEDSGSTPDGSGDDTPTPTPSGGSDGDGDGDGDGGGDGGTETDVETDRQAVTDTINYAIANSPDVFNWNPWTPQDNTAGDLWMSDIHGLRNVHTTNTSYSGTTVQAPHKPDHDEIEIMTWIADYEVSPPYDWRDHHDERAKYWNGDPFDAVAREKHNHVDWFQGGNKFAEGATFNQNAESQWTLHQWMDKGEVPDQEPDPTGRAVLESEAGPVDGNPPIHPDFTEPYLERYRDASSSDQASSVTDDLTSDRISLDRMAMEGGTDEMLAGSGPYRLESMDDVGSEKVVLTLNPDHPNAGHTNVEKLALYWAEGDRRDTLTTEGVLDLDDGAITPGANINRDALPDHIQEFTRWLRATGGDMWKLNWNNPHLERLWVRRALVEAIDWNAVSANGWGEGGSQVLEHDTFMLDAQSESTFSDEFLDNLHTYSRSSNKERATRYMEKAGYSKQGGQWVDPQGNAASIDIVATSDITAHVQAAQTIRANLTSWGFGVNLSTQGWSTWSNNIDPNGGLNYDSTIFWHGDPYIFQYYHDRGAWWDEALVAGSPTAASPFDADPEDEVDTQGKPITQMVPDEAGAFEAPDEAGAAPDLENATEVNLVETVNAIRQPGNSEEDLQELYRTCAKYYNFYVPHFPFHQYLMGAYGDVRDFDWPDPGARAFDYERSFGIEDVLVLGGIAQASTDEDFEPPQ